MNLDSASKQKDWKFSRPSSKWSCDVWINSSTLEQVMRKKTQDSQVGLMVRQTPSLCLKAASRL
jgi:hypothetical protein